MSPIKIKQPKPDKPKPTTTTTTTPAPKPVSRLGSYGNASIDQWDDVFIAAYKAVAKKRGVNVNPRVLKAMMDVETGGDGNYSPTKCRPSDGFDNVPACGPMQIKWQYHKDRCPECNSKTVAGQVEMAAHIIGMTMQERGKDEYDAITAVYFPGADINGTTQAGYLARVRKLVKAMEADSNGTTPAVTTTPAPKPKLTRQQVADIILGGVQVVSDTFRFNQRNPGQHLYKYGVGHGTESDESHTGDDLFVPLGTVIHTPLSGVVRCVGNQGSGDWGQGCGSFNDTITGGVGNVTVLTDAGPKITFGHVNRALVTVGQRVNAGQAVATSGGMFSPHLHLDVSVNRNGSYFLLDPIPAIIEAMTGDVPTVYAERVPFEVLDDNPEVKVTVVAESLPVLQYANPDAAPVRKPLTKGEVFYAGTQAYGTDNKWWWVTSTFARIPVEGTEAA